jgi:hypothetical protein
MGVLDFRQFLPGFQQAADQGVDMLWRPNGNFAPTPPPMQAMQQLGAENPGTTFWATGGGPNGAGTFSVPTQPSGAPQQDPPPPVGTPKQPEILTDPDTSRTAPPPPISPRKQPEVTTPIIGPDNKPTSDDRLKPTPASTAAAAGNDWDRVMKWVKDPKNGAMIGALAKMGGGGKGPAPPGPYHMHMIGPTNPGFNQPNIGSAQQMLEGVMKPKYALGRKRKERQDDPYQFEQDTYDFRRLKGRG